jgi:hypothetical protein
MGKRKIVTYEEVYNGFIERGLQLDILKDEYINQYVKLKCHCIKHPNNELFYSWQYVRLNRFSCKECNKENPKYHKYPSIQERIDFINNNTFFTYISGMTEKTEEQIIVKCDHGHQFPTTNYAVVHNATKCPLCNNKVYREYWNIETCQKWLDENDIKYTVLDFKKNKNGNKVFIHCENMRHKPYWTSWTHIQGGTRCKECYYDNEHKKDWNLENAKELLKSFGYEMIDESLYIASHYRIPCKDKYGFIYMVSVHYLLRGRTVFSIWKSNPYAVHNINLYCKLFRPDYEFITQKYLGNKSIHTWRYIGEFYNQEPFERNFEMTFGSFINSGCKHPKLTMSLLEIEVHKVLVNLNLKYEVQKTFDGCKNKIKLRFDFYLNEYNCCVEADGTQHMLPVEAWGGEKQLLENQKRDEIKNKYCKDNKINLIRIPYNKMKHIEEILTKALLEKFKSA